MTSEELREKFLKYFEEKGHKILPSASLVPQDDPSVLFTTAGMQPLVPYFLGEKHPEGKRLANSQKCLRTDDIEEVGDNVHHTFFEMLGNWSLNDYFKEDAIRFSYEFLTSRKWLGVDKEKLAISVFKGDEDAPFDVEAYNTWVSLGISKERIVKLPKKNNWWGQVLGPCGPNTEMFYWSGAGEAPRYFDHEDERWVEIWNDVFMEYNRKRRTILVDFVNCLVEKDANKINKELADLLEGYNTKIIVVTNADYIDVKKVLSAFDFQIFTLNKEPDKSKPEFFEKLLKEYKLDPDSLVYIDHKKENVSSANKVGIKSELYKSIEKSKEFIDFNQYYFTKLEQKNVDTGMGLERALAVLNGLSDNYQTDLFLPIVEKTEELSGKTYQGNEKSFRVIADHIRASVFAITDGVTPSNKGRGYIVRRLIRRAIVKGQELGISEVFTTKIVDAVADIYKGVYDLNTDLAKRELQKEEEKFRETLRLGLKEFEKIIVKNKAITGKESFDLFQTYGFPFELIKELAAEKEIDLDEKGFYAELKNHQDLSRTASAGMFRGGLGGQSELETKYHTATHLLHEALRRVLGPHVYQRGSNITDERMRFDFSHPDKMTEEEIKKVEEMVNKQISSGLPVIETITTVEEAKGEGAIGIFDAKYGEKVKVYSIGGPLDSPDAFSKEICGGPHVKNTSELGHFKIKKEESSSAGVRRIKAILG